MNRALVTGAAGLLGQRLVRKLRNKFKVLALDIAENPFDRHPNIDFNSIDLTNFDSAKTTIDGFGPDIIFNCAAYTDVDGCEENKALALSLNVGVVETILRTEFGKLVQFSTDYVFDGKSGPYSEKDETEPVGYYGWTKLQSEKMISNSGRNSLIIRTNVLFGTGRNIRPNFVTWLIERLKSREKLRIVTDQFNNPIHAENLADAAIEGGTGKLKGILHVGGASYLSRHEMAVKIAGFFNFDPTLIEAVTTDKLGQTARRPLRGGLKIDLARKKLKTRLLTFDQALELMAR